MIDSLAQIDCLFISCSDIVPCTDTEVCEDMSNQEEYISQHSLILTSELSQTCNVSVVKTKAKNLQPALTDADKEAVLVPITPEFDREGGECQHGFFTSPLTFVPTPPKDIYHQSDLNDGPSSIENEESLCTPQKGTFDPFAPGPDKFMLAPHCRKYAHESQTGVVRRLNFDPTIVSDIEIDDGEAHVGTTSNDEILLETVYGSLLEAIISTQAAERNSAKVESVHDSVPDGFKTPISAHRLSGVAETCPRAPVKPTNKFRNIEKGLCRKLEF